MHTWMKAPRARGMLLRREALQAARPFRKLYAASLAEVTRSATDAVFLSAEVVISKVCVVTGFGTDETLVLS